MTTTTDWRSLTDKLTPEQVRHLEADERIAVDALRSRDAHTRATGQEMLNMLPDEAAFYAGRNAEVGIEPPADLELFRTVIKRIDPGQLQGADTLALLNLIERNFAIRGVK